MSALLDILITTSRNPAILRLQNVVIRLPNIMTLLLDINNLPSKFVFVFFPLGAMVFSQCLSAINLWCHWHWCVPCTGYYMAAGRRGPCFDKIHREVGQE